ncbi:TIGR03943 family putative permease subunit [Prochlorococcus sp. MIT 1307]|uniref:TIGR03943 family putative permease subunit n=1 Tax=Prochlorococcus sp. MIT 1307 TaxID=3096219 RepID=UPI002A7654CD|nr:TIGR03943 family protein [Prochlorococcus sp. MIT 1307]
MATLIGPILLGLWGWLMLWSTWSGRLALLLRGVFHPVVGVTGMLLIMLAVILLFPRFRQNRKRIPLAWSLSSLLAIFSLLFPPDPSFSELAANRPGSNFYQSPRLTFYLPPEQRTLMEWVFILNSQPDPYLHNGAPVRIKGFVLDRSDETPMIARLMVRCCLADATPVGLHVQWPEGVVPKKDEWLEIEGIMAVHELNGNLFNVVQPKDIRNIPRPKNPLEL